MLNQCFADLPCSSLMIPANGNISCNGNQAKGTVCNFKCNNGYLIRGSTQRTCLPTSEWSGSSTSCEIMHCEVLGPPKNGLLILPCDTQYKAICNVQCSEGYYSNSSNDFQVCKSHNNNTMYWSDPPICYG